MKIYRNIKLLNQVLIKQQPRTIVFTNGVFDILHPGHIDIIEFARMQGDCLIVGINDDDSVKRLKGAKRPIIPLVERMEVLEAMEFIDFIIPFKEDTPTNLIRNLIRIDVLVKGGDYKPGEVVGRQEVESSGGKLSLFNIRSDYSTSSLIKKVHSSG